MLEAQSRSATKCRCSTLLQRYHRILQEADYASVTRRQFFARNNVNGARQPLLTSKTRDRSADCTAIGWISNTEYLRRLQVVELEVSWRVCSDASEHWWTSAIGNCQVPVGQTSVKLPQVYYLGGLHKNRSTKFR